MFTLWYLYKGYEELREHAEKLKTPTESADSIRGSAPTPKPSIPTPTVTPPTPSPLIPSTPTSPNIPVPEKQVPLKPTPEKSSPIQIPEKKQEDLRPKSKEEIKLAEGLPKSVISPIEDDDLLLTRPKVPEQLPRTPQVEPEAKTVPATTPAKEQPQWQPILKPEEPKRAAPVTIPQWDSFPKTNAPKREDFANLERGQETLSRGEDVPKGPHQEFYQRKKEFVDSSEEEEEEDDDTDQDF